ncbi:hypothetical protein EVAR_16738_1 [Eumeta japonica]|uniref:Uncharacterized protein n=1 Tax=Eumeta variegata TaxID=151549 RepID=A0A4C1UKT7_EUMVA|nr:hypothetical protein EVAR_16738_1 [Eumeta japonica]
MNSYPVSRFRLGVGSSSMALSDRSICISPAYRHVNGRRRPAGPSKNDNALELALQLGESLRPGRTRLSGLCGTYCHCKDSITYGSTWSSQK